MGGHYINYKAELSGYQWMLGQHLDLKLGF
jgi:hypothetical protein